MCIILFGDYFVGTLWKVNFYFFHLKKTALRLGAILSTNNLTA